MYNNKNKKDYFRNRDFANPNFFNSNNNNNNNSNNASGDKRGKDSAAPSVSVRYDRTSEAETSDAAAHSSGAGGSQFVSGGEPDNVFNNNNTNNNMSNNTQDPPTENSATGTDTEHTDEAELEIAPHLHKHPLQNTWTLWYLENDRTKSWEEMQNEITSFDTVEDFWSLYNHIKTPSELKIGCDYSLFKKDIRPMWEDTANKQGGRWVITMNKNCKEDLDNIWLDVMLCLIGETFANNEEICGAVVNIRSKSNKISIWTANGNNKDAALEIGYKLRDTLHLRPQNLQYQSHKDTMVKQGSAVVKSIYVL